MKAFLQYASYVARHKWFVFVECLRYGMFWRGLMHDASKLLPSEWLPYQRYFYGRKVRDATGYYKPTDTGDSAFDFAWLLHQKRNRHHWQWWILPEDSGGVKVLEMDRPSRREMVADWRGAGRAQRNGVDTVTWYRANGHKMQLGPETRAWVEREIGFKP